MTEQQLQLLLNYIDAKFDLLKATHHNTFVSASERVALLRSALLETVRDQKKPI
jgi:hypothetical protein